MVWIMAHNINQWIVLSRLDFLKLSGIHIIIIMYLDLFVHLLLIIVSVILWIWSRPSTHAFAATRSINSVSVSMFTLYHNQLVVKWLHWEFPVVDPRVDWLQHHQWSRLQTVLSVSSTVPAYSFPGVSTAITYHICDVEDLLPFHISHMFICCRQVLSVRQEEKTGMNTLNTANNILTFKHWSFL